MNLPVKNQRVLLPGQDTRIVMILEHLRRATTASSFDAAAYDISEAVYSIDLGGGDPLSESDFEAILVAIEQLAYRSAAWPFYAYARELADGLQAAMTLIVRWNKGNPPDRYPSEWLDLTARTRILRNAAHSAVLAREVNARAHARVRSARAAQIVDWHLAADRASSFEAPGIFDMPGDLPRLMGKQS